MNYFGRNAIYAGDAFNVNGVYLVLHQVDRDGRPVAYARPVEFDRIDEQAYDPGLDSRIPLHREEAQILVDHLWRLGIRPSESGGSVGALAQAEAHIASLRQIATALLPAPKRPRP